MANFNSQDDEEDLFFNPYDYEVIVISSDDDDNESLPSSGNSLPSSDDSEIDEVNFHPENDFFGAWVGEIMGNTPFPYAQKIFSPPIATPTPPHTSPIQ